MAVKRQGRTSGAALAAPGAVSVINRPDPPLDLTEMESDVWRQMVDAMPADWFPRESWPLLRQYCRHTVMASRVSQMIDTACARDEVDVAELRELTALQARETAALKALAASMRLSQQASYSARGAAGEKTRRTTVKRPWET